MSLHVYPYPRRRFVICWRPPGRCALCGQFVGYAAPAWGNGRAWCRPFATVLDDARIASREA